MPRLDSLEYRGSATIMNHDGNCPGERDYYKFVDVRQEGLLSSTSSSSPTGRRLSIRFFSKALALVGEHRALSFLYGVAMILTPPRSQDFRSHSTRPLGFFINYHTNIFEHALLHEFRCPCPRGILCSIYPSQVRKGLLVEFKGPS
jgi:hypothetical protein